MAWKVTISGTQATQDGITFAAYFYDDLDLSTMVGKTYLYSPDANQLDMKNQVLSDGQQIRSYTIKARAFKSQYEGNIFPIP